MPSPLSRLADPDHPLWSLAYIAIAALALKLNASNFDHTEMLALAEGALGAWGVSKARDKARDRYQWQRHNQYLDRAGGPPPAD